MCGATDGPRRTDFSAANVPGGTNFSAADVPEGLVLGGTNFCVTDPRYDAISSWQNCSFSHRLGFSYALGVLQARMLFLRV